MNWRLAERRDQSERMGKERDHCEHTILIDGRSSVGILCAWTSVGRVCPSRGTELLNTAGFLYATESVRMEMELASRQAKRCMMREDSQQRVWPTAGKGFSVEGAGAE